MSVALPFDPKKSPLKKRHKRADFSCGKKSLDVYLQRHAGQDMKRGLAAVFILEGESEVDIAGFYALSSQSIEAGDLTELSVKGLPVERPIPCTLLGQFAVHEKWKGQGVGAWLLGHVLHEVTAHAEKVGSFALIVDAVDEEARTYWLHCGFIPFPSTQNRLFLPMKTIKKWLDTE